MQNKKDSVAKGSLSVTIARMFGMLLSFLLFLLLARHSKSDAGVFRTIATYITVADFLSMLGMHRWLATEIALEGAHRWPLFLATNVFVFGVSVLITIGYLGISIFHIYSSDINSALAVAALIVVPSGIFACVQSTLVGIGKSYYMGKLNMLENVLRCSVSILLIIYQQPIIYVIWVFVVTRWLIALFSLRTICENLNPNTLTPQLDVIKQVCKEAPRFGLIILAFLTLRNFGLMLLPALAGAEDVADYAVAYQLFDLILLVPSVLALTSNNYFASKAVVSSVALKRASTQLLAFTSIGLFPLAAITAGLSSNFLQMLYGNHYLLAGQSLRILMLAACAVMIDQVLSQTMVAQKDYKSDLISILAGGIFTIILSLPLTRYFGATGTALALLLAILITVITRLIRLKRMFSLKLLFLSVWRPTLASIIIFIVIIIVKEFNFSSYLAVSRFWWLLIVPPLLLIYLACLFLLGGMSSSKIQRIKKFLFHH